MNNDTIKLLIKYCNINTLLNLRKVNSLYYKLSTDELSDDIYWLPLYHLNRTFIPKLIPKGYNVAESIYSHQLNLIENDDKKHLELLRKYKCNFCKSNKMNIIELASSTFGLGKNKDEKICIINVICCYDAYLYEVKNNEAIDYYIKYEDFELCPFKKNLRIAFPSTKKYKINDK